MILQWIIIGAFWLSYLTITLASVIIIADFVERVQRRRAKKPKRVFPESEHEDITLQVSGGLLEVNRVDNEQAEH